MPPPMPVWSVTWYDPSFTEGGSTPRWGTFTVESVNAAEAVLLTRNYLAHPDIHRAVFVACCN